MDSIPAKKSLGQNFLKDEVILKRIADTFSVTEKDLIVEIGPGKGALTKYLIQKSSSTLCYELDPRLKHVLFSFDSEKCHFIFDDFLKRDLFQDIGDFDGNLYFIANIPYYITTPIIMHILESGLTVSGMTLLVQKEVALRFSAQPNTRDYGYFTVLLQHFFDIELLFDVPSSSFDPPPKVTSSVVKFVRKNRIEDIDFARFDTFLKKAFSQKRKTLRNNLGTLDFEKILPILEKYQLPITIRAEEVSYELFLEFFRELV